MVGLDEEGLAAPSDAANPSLGLVEVELLRRVNEHLGDFRSGFDRGRWIRGYLGEGGVLPSSREKFRPGEEKLADLLERSRRSRAMLAEGGFDVVGDADLLEPADIGDRRHPSEVSDSEMLGSATVAMARMMGDVRSLTQEGEPAPGEGSRRRGARRLRARASRLSRRGREPEGKSGS